MQKHCAEEQMDLENEKGNLNSVVAILRRWPLIPIVVIWFVVFWPMNTGQTVVGFRDSAYLYYPYFKWIEQQWAVGEIPLWNPYCDLGYPVVADGSSSVFYPGKLIFFLKFLEYPIRYGWYLSLHVLLAVFGGYFLARRLGADQLGSTLSGFTYGFGGSVLFQVCNVIYLVSAAWLPFGLAAVWAMSRSSRPKHCIAAGIVAALMILGGDPQMAYMLGVIAAATLTWTLFRRRYRLLKRKLFLRAAVRYVSSVLVFAVVAFALASIQILPTYFWVQQSSRMNAELDVIGLTIEEQGGSLLNAVYQFSQPPWTLGELVWPNLSGKPFPIHRRWVDVLAGTDRFWTPSLYVGLLTAICGFGGIRFWGKSRKRIWLTGLLLVFAVGSFGWYGAIWLYRDVALQLGYPISSEGDQCGPYVGGLYWLATIVLPKFAMFRYPAKLFVVASLGICVLAGLQFDSRFFGRRFSASLIFVSILSIGGLFLLPRVWPELNAAEIQKMSGWDLSVLFGPLDWTGSRVGFQFALCQTLILAIMILLAACLCSPKSKRLVLITILFCELLIANHWLVPQVDSERFESKTAIADRVNSLKWAGDVMPTLFRGHSWHDRFAVASSPDRLSEIVAWQREQLHPKHHLDLEVVLLGSFASIEHPGRLFTRNISSLVEGQPKPFQRSRFYLTHPDTILDSSGSLYGAHVQQGGVTIVENGSNHVHVKVVNDAMAKLVYLLTPARGWQVETRNFDTGERQLAKVEFGRNSIAIELPAGEFEVTYAYDPIEFWIGLWISCTAWSVLLLSRCFRFSRRFRLNLFQSNRRPT